MSFFKVSCLSGQTIAPLTFDWFTDLCHLMEYERRNDERNGRSRFIRRDPEEEMEEED